MSLIPLKNRLISPSHIYYDIQVYNKRSSSGPALQLEFNEARNSAFVNKANDYQLSIIRFQTDTTSLPSYIVQIQPNQSNINLTQYSITLERLTRSTGAFEAESQQYIIWSPENKDIELPIAPNLTLNKEQQDTEYYYGSSMKYLIKLIEDAVKSAITAISGVNNSIYLNWNESEAKLEVYGEYEYFGEDGINAKKYNLYFNRELQSLFSTLSFDRYFNALNGKYYRLRFDNLNLNKKSIGNKDYILNTQEFSTISNISPVSSIVFSSSTIPIVPNQLSNPIITVNNQSVINGNNSNFLPIITDISVNDQFYKPNIIYNPSAQYRYVDLSSSQPINNVDIKCWWKDKSGVFHPLYLYSGMSASLKILFEKKETEYILATAEQNL
jgi:hypothetical protein